MLKEDMIIEIANVLTTSAVESKAIHAALELLCESLSFDGGLVYEIDHDHRLYLKEHIDLLDVLVYESFSMEEVEKEYFDENYDDKMHYVTSQTSGLQAKLLAAFNVKSLLIMELLDEYSKRIGFIVFYNMNDKPLLNDTELRIIKTILHMLARYIEGRIHQRKLFFAQNSFVSILDNTGIDIYVNDFYNHDILYVNKSMAAPYGGVESFVNRKCYEVLFPEQNGPCSFCPQQHLIDEEGNPTKVYTWDYKRAMDGSWFRVFSSAFRWVDGRLGHVVSSADITDNKKNEELINYMANYDLLTKLPNRRKLVTDLEEMITQKSSYKKYILFFDIDGFKAINDNYGHDGGDEFLIQLGAFFTSMDILKDAVYRHGGDEFVAIIDGRLSKEQIKDIVQVIHQRFTAPWILKKGAARCNTSVGVACYPEDGNTVEGLLHKADQAMYKIKKMGGASICFNQSSKQ